jgi:hypothetical protein
MLELTLSVAIRCVRCTQHTPATYLRRFPYSRYPYTLAIPTNVSEQTHARDQQTLS